MEVFVVTETEWDSSWVFGVYATEELAESAIAKKSKRSGGPAYEIVKQVVITK